MCCIFMRKKNRNKGENPLMSQFSAPISPNVPVKFHPPPLHENVKIIYLWVPFLTMLTSVAKWIVYVRPGLYYNLLSKNVTFNWIFWPHEWS